MSFQFSVFDFRFSSSIENRKSKIKNIVTCLSLGIVFISGCAGKTPPSVNIKMAGDYITDARESVAVARGEGSGEYAPQEFARAESLIERAQEALRKRKSRDAADLAFLADTEAKIATALAREAKAKRRAEEATESKLDTMLEAKTDQVAAAKARQAIAERIALEAQKEVERVKVRADKQVQRAKVELAIAKAEFELSIYRETVKIDTQTPEDELPPYAKELYVSANSRVEAAKSALADDDFQMAANIAEEAARYASNALVQARAKLDAEAEEALRTRDRVVAAMTKAGLSVEEGKGASATSQYAKDMYEKAEILLKEASLALKNKEYDRAESLAEQARVSASNALTLAEVKEREAQAREAQEDAKANALDAVAKAERLIAKAQAAGAVELADDVYRQAQTALDGAEEAVLEEDFEKALSLAQESVSHSAIALATAEAKTECERKIEETENSIMEEASKISETSVRRTNRGVVISMGGTLFAPGSSQIRSDARDRLKMLAQLLKKHSDYKIIIEGHTDNIGPEESNLKISSERASNFLRYMVDTEGIPLERLSSVGYGESRPIASNINEAGRRQNRRVDIVILTAPVSP